MVKIIKKQEFLEFPSTVSVSVNARKVTVKGSRGTLTRDFSHIQGDLAMVGGGKKLRIDMWFSTRKQLAAINSVKSEINNMILGVTKGFRYKMRLVYAHFPINVNVADNGAVLEIRNFLGEKITRKVAMLGDVKVSRSQVKDEIILEGNDVIAVSQSAASVWQSTLVKGKDIRKFLDGIYVSERGIIE
eukprot:EC722749.1.p1 GENE.EC722749.1~~EC722749.1.p1  ORF type:complete len:188 (+),score=66.09 EC722749.1:42-605(+)